MLARYPRPRLFDHLQGYSRAKAIADITAGITVGFVALPLAMTFAIASGLPPQAGLVTAIVAGLLTSLLGGSSVQIGGPAGAFIVVVFAIVERYGVPNLLIATACAGLLMMLMGVLRLGELVRLIPVPVVSGFTSGIAVLIALSQMKEFFGLPGAPLPAEFFSKMSALWRLLPEFHLPTALLGVACVLLIVLWPKSNKVQAGLAGKALSRLPGSLLAIVVSTLLVATLELPVETVRDRFGSIPQGFPAPSLPEFNWATVQFLLPPILTIALLGAIESLLCARVSDGITKERHSPNQELFAQGMANLVSPVFGGFCATGAVARTITNIRAGAQSPVAGIVHALTLLVIVLGAAPLAEHIPLVALAATALVVAYNMVEWKDLRDLKRHRGGYRAILLATLAITIVLDITVAVEVGLVLAVVFFVRRMVTLTKLETMDGNELADNDLRPPPGVEVARLTGVLFFGAVRCLEPLMQRRAAGVQTLVLDLSSLLGIDSTGIEALETLNEQLAHQGVALVLCSARPEVVDVMNRFGLSAKLGQGRLQPSLRAALDHH